MHEELVKRLRESRDLIFSEKWARDDITLAIIAINIGDAISALTAPQAETCEHEWHFYQPEGQPLGRRCGKCWTWQSIAQAHAQQHPWTREDGSTTPVRGDVVDRRKSAAGNIRVAIRRSWGVGRRSGDAARWTVQETPQTLVYSDGDRFRELMLAPEASAHLFTLLAQGKGDKAAFVKMLDRIMDSRRSAMK